MANGNFPLDIVKTSVGRRLKRKDIEAAAMRLLKEDEDDFIENRESKKRLKRKRKSIDASSDEDEYLSDAESVDQVSQQEIQSTSRKQKKVESNKENHHQREDCSSTVIDKLAERIMRNACKNFDADRSDLSSKEPIPKKRKTILQSSSSETCHHPQEDNNKTRKVSSKQTNGKKIGSGMKKKHVKGPEKFPLKEAVQCNDVMEIDPATNVTSVETISVDQVPLDAPLKNSDVMVREDLPMSSKLKDETLLFSDSYAVKSRNAKNEDTRNIVNLTSVKISELENGEDLNDNVVKIESVSIYSECNLVQDDQKVTNEALGCVIRGPDTSFTIGTDNVDVVHNLPTSKSRLSQVFEPEPFSSSDEMDDRNTSEPKDKSHDEILQADEIFHVKSLSKSTPLKKKIGFTTLSTPLKSKSDIKKSARAHYIRASNSNEVAKRQDLVATPLLKKTQTPRKPKTKERYFSQDVPPVGQQSLLHVDTPLPNTKKEMKLGITFESEKLKSFMKTPPAFFCNAVKKVTPNTLPKAKVGKRLGNI